MSEWKPPEVLGLCPICHDEFYVPHGGKCPAEHDGDAPDLIEYVPAAQSDRYREAINRACYALDPNQGERPNPARAYEWLRTTFPPDHPSYVDPAALSEGSSDE